MEHDNDLDYALKVLAQRELELTPEFRRWISGPRVEKGNEVRGSLESGRMERFGGAEGSVECGESGSSTKEKSAPPAGS